MAQYFGHEGSLVVRIFFSASSAAAGLTEKTGAGSRYRRRMGAAGAAAVLLAGLGVAAAGRRVP